MAAQLGRAVTAEGIETAERLAPPRALGCQRGQRYDVAPPLPAEEMGAVLDGTERAVVAMTVRRHSSPGVIGAEAHRVLPRHSRRGTC